MGNYFSSQSDNNQTTSYRDQISDSDKFSQYQTKFRNLIPSRNLYLNGDAVVVDSETANSYTSDTRYYDWSSPDTEQLIYKYLDMIYEIYKNRNPSAPALEFVTESLDGEIDNWADWLDQYFYHGSLGHQLFTDLNQQVEPVTITRDEKVWGFPPQLLWMLLLINSVELDTIRAVPCTRPKVLGIYSDAQEIQNSYDETVAIVAPIEGKWYYVGITSEYLEKIWDLYEEQYINQYN